MSTSLLCLLGYVAWSLALGFALVATRVTMQVSEGRPANAFALDGADLPPLGHRITRAHGNSIEWLAAPVALLLLAIATGQTAITDGLAPLALAGRIAQSTTHLISTSAAAVMARGAFLGVQTVVWVIWIYGFATAA